MDVGFLDLGKQLDDVRRDQRAVTSMRLARAAEDAGATRYWVAEHHVPDVGLHAPEVVLPLIAASTERIRVGAAGVLLKYYSPLKVWETYTTLADALGDRVDLGLVRGPGVANEDVARLLVSGHEDELAPSRFDDKVRELVALSRNGTGARGLSASLTPPQLWMLGSGPSSAQLAAELDLSFGFMCFPLRQLGGAFDSLNLLPDPRPRVVLALTAACAATSGAGHAADEVCVRRGYLRANVAGSTAECLETLLEKVAPFDVDEVVLACLSPRWEHQQALVPLIEALAGSS